MVSTLLLDISRLASAQEMHQNGRGLGTMPEEEQGGMRAFNRIKRIVKMAPSS